MMYRDLTHGPTPNYNISCSGNQASVHRMWDGHPHQVRRTMVPRRPEVLMVTLFMPTIKMCTIGLLMKQHGVGPGPNQSIFKHLLMTGLDRGGGDPQEGALE